MSDIEDDKPTVVLDINALKEAAKNEKEQLENLADNLEFTAKAPADTNKIGNNQSPVVILFDLNSEYFAKNHKHFPKSFKYQVLSSLAALNKHLQKGELSIVVFNFNAAPKAVNQLCAQIKTKFPKAKTLILAKNLSTQKVQTHQNSRSGANAYLSSPFKASSLASELQKLILN